MTSQNGRRADTDLASVETAVTRAAALLRGGLTAERVWRVLSAEIAHHAPEARMLRAVWLLAQQCGAPLAAALERFGSALHALAALDERRAVLLAGPRATMRLVVVLPPAAALLGALLGFDPLSALRSPLAWAALFTGLVLLGIGWRWSGALAARVAQHDWIAGWEFELTAIALGGGISPRTALRLAAECADRARAEWVRIEELGSAGAVAAVVQEAETLGAPVQSMLLSAAQSQRDRAHAELERAAEQLGVRVLIPIGVCVLPAFILLGVVPVLLAVLGGSGLGGMGLGGMGLDGSG